MAGAAGLGCENCVGLTSGLDLIGVGLRSVSLGVYSGVSSGLASGWFSCGFNWGLVAACSAEGVGGDTDTTTQGEK